MDEIIKRIGNELQSAILLLASSMAYRKSYRTVLLALIEKGEDVRSAIELADKAAKREHKEAVTISREGTDHMLKMCEELTEARKIIEGL